MVSQQASSLERPCILVVEDDSAVRRSLQLLLRSKGYDVRAYGSASIALDDPNVHATHCLVADLMMPGVDGVALLGALRANAWDGPAVLLSGFLDDEAREMARAAGFAAVLDKPMPEARLTEILAGLLGERPVDDRALATD
jgi:CheY-like chemotaxis protein